MKTPIYLLYLNGVVNTSVLEVLRNRLDAMQTELVLDSTSIKELISDKHSFPFNTTGISERPDKTAAKIMEGKIALIADGSPLAIIVPYVFIEEFHNVEDYYIPPFFASFSRFVRIASFFLTLYIVPVYVALATFHQEMLPLTLLITATASRENIPFPTFIEALIMTFIFDIIREGGIRAPRPIGQTISFIGALIIGTAAVDAGIISAPMVIIIAITGITALLNYPFKNMIIFFRLA
ncbi:MAG TPA: spore germination protein, partial [Ruminiclostridium sp.]|nr:spore germination protein [Ruminiclostridium sp.]